MHGFVIRKTQGPTVEPPTVETLAKYIGRALHEATTEIERLTYERRREERDQEYEINKAHVLRQYYARRGR